MKKHFWCVAVLSLSTSICLAQILNAGDDVYLTVKGHCQESPRTVLELTSILNESLVATPAELTVARTLKTDLHVDELTRIQKESRCILTTSTPMTSAPLPIPASQFNLLPRPDAPGFLSEVAPFFNDPLYRKQGFLQIISAESAYRVLMADSEFMKTPVRIGIIDQGMANDSHGELTGIMAPGSDLGRSNITHGQYVLGIMAAQAGNHLGIVGAAPFNTQFTYRSLNYVRGKVNSAHLANTIREFGRLGMDAVNLSIAIQRPCTSRAADVECYHPIVADAAIRRAIQETAKTYGTVFVVSASNEGEKVPRYVTVDDGVLVVGSSTSSGRHANYSNRGAGVDLYVPDNGVYGLTKEGYSSSLSGTSFAAPVVTATAALTRHYLISRGIRPSAGEVARHILRNATVRRDLTRNESSGLELNMGKAISTTQKIESFRR